jgi:hypothetical protein
MQSTLKLALAAFAGASIAHTAQANCDRVFDALEKADKQERVAQYDLETRDQPLTGKPMSVRIGKVVYDGSFAGDMFEAHQTTGVNPVLRALYKARQEGKMKCESAGSENYRGLATDKVRFDNPLLPAKYNPMTLWIAKSNGLPVYHEVRDLGPGGFAWVYGDAVKTPRVK